MDLLDGYTINVKRFRKLIRHEKIHKISIRANYIVIIYETIYRNQQIYACWYFFFPSQNLRLHLRTDLFFNIMEFDYEFGFAWDIHNETDLQASIMRLSSQIAELQEKQKQLAKLLRFKIINDKQQLIIRNLELRNGYSLLL